MSEDRRPYTTLETELLGIVGNDYESLHTIRSYSWDDDVPLPTVREMTGALRELQRRGWVQCFRYSFPPQIFTPIDDFEDDEAETPIELTSESKLWWLITESGLAALMVDREATGNGQREGGGEPET